METYFTALHRIDHKLDLLENVEINPNNPDLKEYIQTLVREITKGESRRKFSFSSETTEIRIVINSLLNGEFENAASSAATRLLRIEKETDEQYGHLRFPIPRGGLFLAYIKDSDNIKKIIISKADHSTFLEDNDLRKHQGLPFDKKIFKALLVELNEQSVGNIYVYDGNMAKYWWSDYLELTEERTNEHNTIVAFKSIVDGVLMKYKNEYPTDINILRNTTIGYFRSNENFVLKNYIETVIDNYVPETADLDIAEISGKIRNLPETKNFDQTFIIKKEVIKSKMITTFNLTDKIDLVLKNYVENLTNEIKASILNGEKYVLIRSESGYEQFPKVYFNE